MKSVFLLSVLWFASVHIANAQVNASADAGKQIFTTRCTSCHGIGKQVVGPDLKDVDKALSEQWIVNFVHSSQSVIKSGDAKAVAVFNQYNKIIMPDHLDLKEQDIKNIISYIKWESQNVAKNPQGPPAIESRPYPNDNGFLHRLLFLDLLNSPKPLKPTDPILWVIIFACIALVAALLLLVRTNDKR